MRLQRPGGPATGRTATSTSRPSRRSSGPRPPGSCSPTRARWGSSTAISRRSLAGPWAGGLLYYDGANLNAILGKVRPGDMGFDVIHMNLHKTFSTPHGGGGPGRVRWAFRPRLEPYLPVPLSPSTAARLCLARRAPASRHHRAPDRVRRQHGHPAAGLHLCGRLLGPRGCAAVAEFATLNANYLMVRLTGRFRGAYPERRASHEFIITLRRGGKELA